MSNKAPLPTATTMITEDVLAYDTRDLCRLLRLGARTIWRWSHNGVMPPPSKVQGRTLWPAQVIRDWVAAGMPRVDRNGRGHV